MNQVKDLLLNVSSAAAAPTGKENVFGAWVAAAGLAVAGWLGGWDKAIQVLLVLMAIDYATGVLGAIKTKTLNSDVMYWGGVRKITVLFVVGLAALIDSWIQPDAPLFRTIAICYYIGREGISVTENLGILGVPLPAKISDFLEQLKKEGENTNGKGN